MTARTDSQYIVDEGIAVQAEMIPAGRTGIATCC